MDKIEITPFVVSDYLDTEMARVGYLNAILETGNSDLLIKAIQAVHDVLSSLGFYLTLKPLH